jgi:hypothetical protein
VGKTDKRLPGRIPTGTAMAGAKESARRSEASAERVAIMSN